MVRVVVPVIPDALARMVTLPVFLPCATPELRTCAIFGLEDFQLKPLNLVEVLPSLKVPVAVNLMDVPLAIVGLAGVIAIDTRCTFATVRPVDPLTVPNVAVIVADPMATLLARP